MQTKLPTRGDCRRRKGHRRLEDVDQSRRTDKLTAKDKMSSETRQRYRDNLSPSLEWSQGESLGGVEMVSPLGEELKLDHH
ncbi:hypothetical protein F2Q69_00063948 [Brassica cretica]|uniref:Uncharacterized protein n=1 Tax=Brassica cretica TaxID=69181 RepID=A0A8S9PMZ4_BRACR|nr:hypothetical protein F2Q69_00063948 [Brassica cretica]